MSFCSNLKEKCTKLYEKIKEFFKDRDTKGAIESIRKDLEDKKKKHEEEQKTQPILTQIGIV